MWVCEKGFFVFAEAWALSESLMVLETWTLGSSVCMFACVDSCTQGRPTESNRAARMPSLQTTENPYPRFSREEVCVLPGRKSRGRQLRDFFQGLV